MEERSAGEANPSAVPQSHTYDAGGNMVRERTERHFEWDHADRMRAFRNQVDVSSRPTIYALYLYDSGGQRVKKLVIKGSSYRTSNYLGSAFEHHAEFDKLDGTGTGKSENCLLHVAGVAMRRVLALM